MEHKLLNEIKNILIKLGVDEIEPYEIPRDRIYGCTGNYENLYGQSKKIEISAEVSNKDLIITATADGLFHGRSFKLKYHKDFTLPELTCIGTTYVITKMEDSLALKYLGTKCG